MPKLLAPVTPFFKKKNYYYYFWLLTRNVTQMFNNYFVEYQMGRKKDQARFQEAFWKI